MTEHRPGQWPVDRPAHLTPVPAEGGGLAPQEPIAPVPVPDVRLVVTVDLTGRYDSSADVSRDLYEQTIRASDCHTVIVRVSEDAMRSGFDLGRGIAGRFYLSVKRIEIHVPAGTQYAYLASEVQRYVRLFCDDHAQTMASLRPPG